MRDVIVVGGGPAGAALALLLGRQGHDVELCEQATFPREKPCGEGLLPAGVEALARLGLDAPVDGLPLDGLRFHVGNAMLRAPFPAATDGRRRHGLGLRRHHLDRLLFEAAALTPNVTASVGASVMSVHLERGRAAGVIVANEGLRRARWVVAADGSRSTVCRRLGLTRMRSPQRVGARIHFRRAPGGPPLSEVHVFLHRGHELYVTPLPGDELTVAMLAHQDGARHDLRTAFRSWCDAEPLLRVWLEGATPTSELMGRAPLLCDARARPTPAGLILLGDAHQSTDPITAGGMSLALLSALCLARHFPAILAGERAARRRFERARARLVRRHRILGTALFTLSQHPALTGAVRRLFEAHPRALARVLDYASRGAPP